MTSRGNDGRTVFLDRIDYATFLDRAAAVARRYGWTLYAYCVMPNHYHFELEIGIGGLSAGMQLLNGGHSRMFNRRYDRTGHVFRNRFYAGLVERDSHLLETARYVELNPVRAGLCRHPGDWPWSSYRGNAGIEVPHALLGQSEALRMLGRTPEQAARAYRAFVRDGYTG